jgi:hypothetical protein
LSPKALKKSHRKWKEYGGAHCSEHHIISLYHFCPKYIVTSFTIWSALLYSALLCSALFPYNRVHL